MLSRSLKTKDRSSVKCSSAGAGGGSGHAGYHLTPVVCPVLPLLAAVFLALSCAHSRKLASVQGQALGVTLQLPPRESSIPELKDDGPAQHDTLKVTDMEGREVLIMRAVKDEQTGEMVATEELQAAVVQAKFRNIAERHGRIDLEFEVLVPAAMQDSEWQLRLHPDMFILGDSLRLDDLVVTGNAYRKRQLRGYELYEMFLSKIVDDPDYFIDRRNLEIFIRRNLPSLWAYRNDSTFVSDEVFEDSFGVTGRQAVEHYTNRFARKRNERRIGRKGKMYDRYVKSPIVTEGIRLDTVIAGPGGDFVYNYVQTITTRPRLRKVDVSLAGEIYDQEKRLYTIPRSEPLTFYISSVSSFADDTEHYVTEVVSRNVSADTECSIDFEQGRADIRWDLSENAREIGYIRSNLRKFLLDETYVLDSVTIAASASPEGDERSNAALAYRRSKAASDYFSDFIREFKDSLQREAGMFINVGDDMSDGGMQKAERNSTEIDFISRSGGENWAGLDELVMNDSSMSDADKERYRDLRSILNADERESEMKRQPWYAHVRNELYPRLRSVRFRFALHRRGQVKDTVHTSVLDTTYMRGVSLLKDHEYAAALELLRPYSDYNTAVAYVAMDYNKSALSILEKLPGNARVNYMLALVHSREGDERKAVEYYIRSCQQDAAYVSRGNLDPEISALIRKYELNIDLD